MSRLSFVALLELAGELSQRDRAVIETVVRLRLASAKQIERLFFTETSDPASRARMTRRVLARLVRRGVLHRLERRVGGVRAGAAGYVFYPASAAQRLTAYWQGEGLRRTRSRYEPSPQFVRHTLGITEAYVQLVEADRAGVVRLLEFQPEPHAWRWFLGTGGTRAIKPDAFVRLGLEASTEHHAFLEIDCGSEGRTALTRKCRAYIAAWQAGVGDPVFPQVIWITTTTRRADLLTEICAALPAEAWKLFAVTTPENALALVTGTLARTGGGS